MGVAVNSRARRYASAFAAVLAILVDVAIPLDANVHAATLTVDPGGEIQTIAQAATLARDGDVVEILPGNYVGDVAVWTQKSLTIRGVAETPVLRANGHDAEGKAIWVVRDGDFVVENVAFEGARVSDHNGAGIRFEGGKLTVRRCRFVDDENGILTSNANDAELVIEDSVFANAPRDRGPLKHLLYVGRIGRLQVTGSRFHQGYEGHLIKSRARENHIAYNLIYDANGGAAAYELEFPNGGLAYVIGNVIGQSATTTNPTVVSYGAEGDYWERNALYLVNNTLTSDARGAWFLRVASDRLPGDTAVVAVNNLTVGLGIFTWGAKGRYDGNYPLLSWALAEPEVLDFRLGASSLLRNGGVAPPVVDGRSLAPTAEFKLPVGTTPIVPRDGWTPGAFQSTDARR